ncbi:MAG: PorV/PorQ family protein [Chlorobiales bacterium]|nr:PorV/PorQ family protein [Chlorobiales bacterium]
MRTQKSNSQKRTLLVLIALLLIVLLGTRTSLAGNSKRTGTAGASELLIPVGGAGTALSGSTLAATSGVEALYWNPAGLARSEPVELMFSSMSYIAGITVSYFAASATFGDIGSFGVSIKSLDFGDIPLTTAEDPEGLTGMTFSPTYLTGSVTYARFIIKEVQVGATFKVVSEKIGDVSAVGYAFDFGLQYASPFGLRLGVALKNVGPQMQFEGYGLETLTSRTDGNSDQNKLRTQITSAPFDLPALFELGLAYELQVSSYNAILFTGNFRNNNFSNDEYQLGAEYAFQKLFFVRAGYAVQPEKDAQTDGVFSTSYSLGVGLNYKIGAVGFRLDYAYRSADRFNGNQIFAIRLMF